MRRLQPVTGEESKTWDELYRNRLRSLQSVDDMIGDLIDKLRSPGSSTTPTSSSPPTTASTSASSACRRARTPGTRRTPRCRSRSAGRVSRPGVRSTNWPATSTSRRPSPTSRARRPPGFVDGRSLRPLMRPGAPQDWRQVYLIEHGHGPGTRPPLKPRTARSNHLSCSRPRTPEVLPRAVRGGPHQAVPLHPVQHRGTRAVRPADRSERAAQHRRAAEADRGLAGGAPRAAARLRRAVVP